MASCYVALHENEKAYEILSKLNASGQLSSLDNLTLYSEVCLLTNRYNESDQVNNKITEQYGSATTNNRISSNPEDRNKWKAPMTIQLSTLSSTKTDFGAYPDSKGDIYFVSSRGTDLIKRIWAGNGTRFLDIYSSNSNGDIHRLKSKVNTKFHEGPLCFHPNGKWVYFTRNNVSSGKNRTDANQIQNLKLYRAEIEGGKWKNIQELAFNSKDYSTGHPCLSNDGTTLYFASDMPGGLGGVDLYKGKVNEQDGSVTQIENVGSIINTSGDEMFPWIYNDYFIYASNGQPGFGGLDLYVTKYSANGLNTSAKNIGTPINSNADDFALTYVSENKGFFSSNRKGFGSDDIYSFVQESAFRFSINLSGNLTELNSHELIPNQPLVIKNAKGEILDTIVTDDKGNFSYEVDPGQEIIIASNSGDFVSNQWNFKASEESDQRLDLTLTKQPDLTINTLIADKSTGDPIEGVHVIITDKNTGVVLFDQLTNNQGTITNLLDELSMNQSLNLSVTIDKKGYLEKTIDLNYQVTKTETINLHELIDLRIGKIEVGTNLADLIDIKPIYFDLGKYNIRTDAAIELDKIVKIMNEYPNMVIELGSHTDCRSSKAFNQKLSQNRAKASASYIQARITTPTRISGVGYGESKLKINCPCEGTIKSTCPEEDHAQNRRTEFIIKKVQ